MPTTLTHPHPHAHRHIPWAYFLALAITFVIILGLALGPSIAIRQPSLIPVTGYRNANELFRQEELKLYDHPASSLGSDSFYEYRMGEWPVKPVDSRFEFRRGEWFGN
jgi:hypothetical protein